jgi:UDP-N-acetylmuramoyl-tripeptide--D-alanyl-D-alanine ligase
LAWPDERSARPLFRLAEVARATGGRLVGDPGAVTVTGVATDSRLVRDGDLFCALRGQVTDGHRFIAGAFEAGARAALVEDPAAAGGRPAVVVADTTAALGDLARAHLRRLRRAARLRVVGVTGSVGKTGTREMCASVAGQCFPCAQASGNLNSEVGVPLAAFGVRERHRVAVFELAMRGPGQIAYLAGICRPEVGVLTQIGPSHLEVLGSMEAVAAAKGELVEAIPARGTAVLNRDDPWQAGMASRCHGRVLWYGRSQGAEVTAVDERDLGEEGVSFTLRFPDGQQAPVHLALLGRHQVENALAAAACGFVLGVTAAEAAAGLARARPAHGRLEVRHLRRLQVIDDTYNASPASTLAALRVLGRLAAPRCAVAVLGDMLELGSAEESGHRDVGREAAAVPVRLLVAVGPRAAWTRDAAVTAGLPADDAVLVQDGEAAQAVLAERLAEGDVVLVKGSRGMHLEEVVDFLQAWSDGA